MQDPSDYLDSSETVIINQKRVVSYSQPLRRMYLREAGLQLMYNGAELEFAACFGVSQKAIESNIVFLDEEEDVGKGTMAYISSEQITTYRLHSKDQDFLTRDSPGTVTFLSTMRKRDGLVYILAEQFKDSPPDLTLMPVSRKMVRLSHTHLPRGVFLRQVRMPKETTAPRNVCITLSSAPHTISVWRVDKQKLIVEKTVKVTNPVIDQSQENPLQFVLGGNRYFRLWEINSQENTMEEAPVHLVPLKFERDTDFLDLRYLSNNTTLLCLVSGNRILVFENHEQSRTISDLFAPKIPGLSPKLREDDYGEGFSQHAVRQTVDMAKAEKLAITPHGFCVGGTGGYLAVYGADEGRSLSFITTTQVSPSIAHIHSGSVSTDGNFLVLTCIQTPEHTDTDPSATTPPPPDDSDQPSVKLDFYVVNLKKLENELADPVSKLFPASQHLGMVRDVALSLAKNQVVTVGEDQHLRIWHKTTAWKGMIDYKLQENPYSVSLHPSGVQVALGFKETFKVFAVLESELLCELDHVVKSCYSVSYSPGGKYLAANNGGSIVVYSPFTLRVVWILTGHSSPIRSLTWDGFDVVLTSACYGGTVAVWDVSKGEQRSPTIPRQGKVTAAYYDDYLDQFAVLTNDGSAKVISEGGGVTVDLPSTGFVYTAMYLSRSTGLLFLGTNQGKVRVTLWPVLANTDMDKPVIDFQEFAVHSGDVAKITLSDFYGHLVTAGKDGNVVVQSLKLVKSGLRLNPDAVVFQESSTAQPLSPLPTNDGPAMNQLSLVRSNAIEVYNSKLKDLEESISTLKSQQKYALESNGHKHADELEHLRREFDDKLRFEQDYAASLRKETESKAVEFAAKLKEQGELHQLRLEDEVRKHEQAQGEDQERYDQLKDETEDLKRRMAQEVSNILAMHTQIKESLEAECRGKVAEVREAYTALMGVMKAQGEQYETGLVMTEKEYEDEIVTEKQKLERLLEEERESVKNLRLVNSRLNTEKDNIAKKDDILQKENQTLKEANLQTKFEVEELKSRLLKMQEQITEREEVIKKKENTIKELRSFNIHLQNFRFVLDQKIKSLKEDRGPLGEQLTALQGHIRNMYAELLEEFEKTRTSVKQAGELQGKNRSLLEQNREMRNRVLLSNRKIAMIQSDLVQLVKVTNKDTLLMGLKQLIEKHLDMEDMLSSEVDEQLDLTNAEEANLAKVRQEVVYQHDLMKEQLLAAQRKSKALENKKNSEMHRKMQENASLIQECNMLRDQNREFQREISILKDRISKLKSQLKDQITGEVVVSGRSDDPVLLQTHTKARTSTDNLRGRQPLELFKEKNRLTKTVSRPDFRMNSLISELEKNKNEILEQNTQFRRLQEQVSNFLLPDDRQKREEAGQKALQGVLSHNSTLPTLHSSVEIDTRHGGESGEGGGK